MESGTVDNDMTVAPLFKTSDGKANLQLFAAVKKGRDEHEFFVVDHDKYLSATSYIVENGNAIKDFDYVRSAYMTEFIEVFGASGINGDHES